jgi:beta-glucuronidase
LAAVLILFATAALLPSAARAADKPTAGAPYYMGQSARFLVDGQWFLKRDPANAGLRGGWKSTKDFSSWQKVRVPNAFNAGDGSELSYTGYAAWYGTEFERPKTPGGSRWIFQFDSVNLKATIYLNGREIGRHTGGYLPFEVDAKNLRSGTNRLVVRVDSKLTINSIPSVEERSDQLTGGWWNYGGILREVILRRVSKYDITSVTTRSSFKSTKGPAKITVLARVTNYSKSKRSRLRLRGTFGGQRVKFKPVVMRRGAKLELTGTARIRKPKLWEPLSPHLYKVKVTAPGVTYREKAGIRKIKVANNGTMTVNGKKVRLRGVSFHESDVKDGAAWTPTQRDADLGLITKLGANMIRSHYPLSRQILEWADAHGVFVWCQAPVFRPRNSQVKSVKYRNAAAAYVREMVLANRMYPSILVWSLINEPVPATSGSPYLTKLVAAEKAAARSLDPGLVGVDYATAPEDFVQQPGFRNVDVLGINEYFGWYPGSLGSTLDIAGMRPYIDSLNRTYPHQAKFITEFGTEANRNGPADELGTYDFQRNFFQTHMRILRDIPYLNGYFAWVLKDYWVRPGWTGGNPDPQPPFSRKGLFDENGNPKLAEAVVEREFKNTPPFR